MKKPIELRALPEKSKLIIIAFVVKFLFEFKKFHIKINKKLGQIR